MAQKGLLLPAWPMRTYSGAIVKGCPAHVAHSAHVRDVRLVRLPARSARTAHHPIGVCVCAFCAVFSLVRVPSFGTVWVLTASCPYRASPTLCMVAVQSACLLYPKSGHVRPCLLWAKSGH